MSLAIEEQVYASDTVKTAAPPRIPGYYPSTQPHPHYLDVLRSSTVEELQPLKSLGRLVTQSSPLMPFPVGNFAFLNQSPPAAEGICSVALFTKTPDSASPVYPRGRDTPAIQPPRPAALCCPGQRQGKRHRLQPNNSAQHPGPQPTGAAQPQPGQPQPGHPHPQPGHPQPTGAAHPQPQPGHPHPQPGHPQPQPGHPQPQPGHFTEQHLNTVLYGRMNSDSHHGPVSHAISGLRISGNTGGHESQVQLLDRDPVQIPAGLAVSHTYYGGVPHRGVFCSQNLIPKGVRFGPFTGKVVNMSEIKTYDDNSYMWEIFEDGRLSHFIDGKGAASNWMSLVNCARSPQEQNLTALQSEGKIYYETCKDVVEKQELLVWYGDCYLQFMGIPVTLKEMIESQLAEQAEENAEGFKCDRCGKVFAYKYYRDKHLKYTRCVDQGDRKYPCNLCTRSFEKRDRLRIHILHVHEKHRPHKCSVCGKSFSQSSSLNKHTRVHSGERPYKCVYCNKAFTASSILRTHIRQHSGEKPFKCRHCGKAFASHAAHDSHVRRTHSKDKMFSCETCKKTFMEARELSYHQAQHHAGEGRQVGAVATQELHSMPTDQTDSMTGDYLYNSSEEPLTTPQNADKGESNPYRVATGGTILHNDGYRPWN